jgi:hypothetical protein
MVEQEIRVKLEETFRSIESPAPVEIKKDYRKLEARYKCTAGEQSYLCSEYKPSHVGNCRNLLPEEGCGFNG